MGALHAARQGSGLMAGLPSLRYPAPSQAAPTAWGLGWRKRWIRDVGSVHRHYLTGELVAFYSDAREPEVRLLLQAELEARANGVAEVMAACIQYRTEWDNMLTQGAA